MVLGLCRAQRALADAHEAFVFWSALCLWPSRCNSAMTLSDMNACLLVCHQNSAFEAFISFRLDPQPSFRGPDARPLTRLPASLKLCQTLSITESLDMYHVSQVRRHSSSGAYGWQMITNLHISLTDKETLPLQIAVDSAPEY